MEPLTDFDKKWKPMPGHLFVEPIRPRASKILATPDDDKVVNFTRCKIIKMGGSIQNPELKPGVICTIVPHGGRLMPVPEGHPERLAIPEFSGSGRAKKIQFYVEHPAEESVA